MSKGTEEVKGKAEVSCCDGFFSVVVVVAVAGLITLLFVLLPRVNTLDNKVDNLSNKVTKLDNKVDNLSNKVTKLERVIPDDAYSQGLMSKCNIKKMINNKIDNRLTKESSKTYGYIWENGKLLSVKKLDEVDDKIKIFHNSRICGFEGCTGYKIEGWREKKDVIKLYNLKEISVLLHEDGLSKEEK